MMSSYAIDYFVTVGVPTGESLQCNEQSYEELYHSAITDIAVMMPGKNEPSLLTHLLYSLIQSLFADIDEADVLDDGKWEQAELYIPESDEFVGYDASFKLPVIVFQRRKVSQRIDHIMEVEL